MTRHKLTIYYSVENCGDGSAYPYFFEDELCAEIHQDLQEDGWGEPCTGSLTITSLALMKSKDVMSRKDYIAQLKNDLKEMGEFNDAEHNQKIEKAIAKLEAAK